MLNQRLVNFLELIRFRNPAGTLLLLWPTLIALWFASNGYPGFRMLSTFVLGAFLCRSAGCCFNDILDQNFDKHVKRTKTRPLASGKISQKEALFLGLSALFLSFLLILWLPTRVWILATEAAILMLTYPLTKRFLKIPQTYLGVCFGFGVPMAYQAVQGRIPSSAIIMWLASFFWTLSYDTIYAMIDREDDIAIGINSSALFLGSFDLAFVITCGLLSIMLWGIAAYCEKASSTFYVGLAVASMLMVYLLSRIRNRDREMCFRVFVQNHWIGAIIFLGTITSFFHLQ